MCEGSDGGEKKDVCFFQFLFLLSAERQGQNSLLGSKVQEGSRE